MNNTSPNKDPFARSDFDPEKYVGKIASDCIGGTELLGQKAKVQNLSDETHVALKKNVFQHYEQFIETAKDISYLAGEMYQISQILREQRSLVQGLLDTSFSNKPENIIDTPTEVDTKEKEKALKQAEEESRKKLLSVLEKVEGAAEIIEEENKTRALIFEGDLLEIDPDNYSAVQRKRGYLFNDGIMLASWMTNRRGPQRYKLQAFYELGSVGLVVNIKDPECPKCTFKLLIFPSVHLLQCPNQQEKDSWINHIESLQKILRNPIKHSLTKASTIDSPINEKPASPEFGHRSKSPEDSMSMSLQHPLPEWILDIPEDLDVWIAQRNFTEAVTQYEGFLEFLEGQPQTNAVKEVKAKVDSRIKGLIDILVSDLEIMTPEKILQGGPRSIRKSVDLLIRLGRENQASQLFLAHRTAYIKQRLKRLKTEGRSQIYLDQTAIIFFQSIMETIREYTRLFTERTCGIAGLVVWVNSEVVHFMNSYCRQLFVPQVHLSSVAKSIGKLRSECMKLSEFGVDVTSSVDTTLLPYIERTVTDAKEKLIEAVKHRYRSLEDVGTSLKFSDEAALERTITELNDLGIEEVGNYVNTTKSLTIGINTVAFAKTWLHFCEDVMLLFATQWQPIIDVSICEVLLAELKQLERARKKINSNQIGEHIRKDAMFVLRYVCKAAHSMYTGTTGEELPELIAVIEEYIGRFASGQHSGDKKTPVPLPRSPKPKGSTSEEEYV